MCEIFLKKGGGSVKKLCFAVAFLLVVLCGCSGDIQSDFFALPHLPETHSALLETVDQVRSEGFEFAEPRSGFNRSPLNLMDIDGDGEDEGIVFLRNVTDTYKTYIYIFEQADSVFGLFDIIEGEEKEIYTVSYSQLLDTTGYQIIVKWGADENTAQNITAYNLGTDGIEEVLSLSAEQFSVSDISGDGRNEFLAVVDDNGKVYADIYEEDSGEIRKAGRVHLSENDGRVIRILSGKATDTRNAAFIERESGGVVITDAIAYDGDEYLNLLPEGDACRVRALCSDVDGDGIIELPKVSDSFSEDGKKDTTYIWRSLDEGGRIVPKAFTYHSFTNNWYFSMPMSWANTVVVSEERIGAERIRINFQTREKVGFGEEESFVEAPLFSVYMFTGSNRKTLATQDDKFIISEREGVIFAGEIISDGYLGEAITQEFIKAAFKTRESDWASEVLFA